jgi:hypothetical protein
LRLKSSSSRLSFLPNPKNDMPARAKEGEERVPAHKTDFLWVDSKPERATRRHAHLPRGDAAHATDGLRI